jgi:hypothetical protein
MEMIIEEIEPVKKKKSNCLCIYEGCDKRSSFNFKEKQQLNTVLLINWKIWLM